MPDLRELIRKAKVVALAAGIALLSVGFLLGVLAAKWVGR